jgi:hypothetical protein
MSTQTFPHNGPPHKEDQIRNLLRHTDVRVDQVSLPWIYKAQAELQFPSEISGSARIRFNDGIRIVDWEKTQWVSYEKEGVRWYKDELSDRDYEVLYELLKPVIRNILDLR